jgi:hypothetical protein
LFIGVIDPVLLRKYEQTQYRVLAEGAEFLLPLGRPCAGLADLYRRHGAATAAFITAFTPYSQPVPEAQNVSANARLRDDLTAAGARLFDAVGSDPAGSWKEPSFLALGLSREEAEALGRAHRQNAIVFADADAIPELLLLR